MATARDFSFMQRALELANSAMACNEVPVGALVVLEGEIIGEGSNRPVGSCDPSAHAEIVALRAAARRQQNYRLPGATLYATIEPCTMCFGALIHARIARLVYGAAEPRAGAVHSQLQLPKQPFFNHKMTVEGGVLERESALLLKNFFQERR